MDPSLIYISLNSHQSAPKIGFAVFPTQRDRPRCVATFVATGRTTRTLYVGAASGGKKVERFIRHEDSRRGAHLPFLGLDPAGG